ncbi:MAG TPA: biopolymer transporter ExbD [Rhodanobacteraceae bacterium]|nr:biopolymer transporter ExbD [Rhodanobacteraceae bacterium]
MGMSTNSGGGAMADINVTPMVDVLLVLLIIFMITAPKLQHDIQIDLPQPNKNHEEQKNPPDPVDLRIGAGGSMSWNGQSVDEISLKAQLLILGTKPLEAQSELRIQADPATLYETLAKVMAEAKNAGVKKIGFLK